MRTIQFRGKRVDNGKWVYGFLADEDYINDVNSVDLSSIEVDKETVGQFTGLFCSNGDEIYEGDILRITQVRPKNEANVDRGICVVEFSVWNGWSVGTRWDRYAFNPNNPIDVIEIIGNIHDNPELLKGGAK